MGRVEPWVLWALIGCVIWAIVRAADNILRALKGVHATLDSVRAELQTIRTDLQGIQTLIRSRLDPPN